MTLAVVASIRHMVQHQCRFPRRLRSLEQHRGINALTIDASAYAFDRTYTTVVEGKPVRSGYLPGKNRGGRVIQHQISSSYRPSLAEVRAVDGLPQMLPDNHQTSLDFGHQGRRIPENFTGLCPLLDFRQALDAGELLEDRPRCISWTF